MCPHCQTVNPANVPRPIFCSTCACNVLESVAGCQCWFCAPAPDFDLLTFETVPKPPPVAEPPYSLEVQEEGWEINLDIGNTCAVLSVDTSPCDDEFGPYIIDRKEYVPIIMALAKLLSENERLELADWLIRKV